MSGKERWDDVEKLVPALIVLNEIVNILSGTSCFFRFPSLFPR